MKKILIAMLFFCATSMLFAQTLKQVQPKKMMKKVGLQVEGAVFEKAYHDYTDLVLYTDNAPAKKQEQALLEMAHAYMQLPVMSRIERYCLYFQGQWAFRDKDPVVITEFLAEQKKLLPQNEQEGYAAFLKQINEDIANYHKLHRPMMDAMIRR